jgi:hypothetical protein
MVYRNATKTKVCEIYLDRSPVHYLKGQSTSIFIERFIFRTYIFSSSNLRILSNKTCDLTGLRSKFCCRSILAISTLR